MRYSLDRNALIVYLGDRKLVIPVANIQHILNAQSVIAEIVRSRGGSGRPQTVSMPTKVVKQNSNESTVQTEPELSEIQISSIEVADASADIPEAKEAAKVAEVSTDSSEISEGEVVEIVEEPPKSAPPEDKPASSTPFSVNGSLIMGIKPRYSPFSSWPGYYLTKGWLEPLGEIQFYSTAPFDQTILIRTESAVYAISPENRQQFLIEYNLRRTLGATESVTEGVQGGVVLNHPLWTDKVGQLLLAVGIIANLALFAFLLARLPSLPDSLGIHFNKFGGADRIGARGDIMWLPFIGFFSLLTNSVLGAYAHKKERVLGLLLFSATLIIHFILLIAVFTIIPL
jgi:hypothetical protein